MLLEKNYYTNLKRHFSMPLHLGMNKQIPIWNCLMYDDLRNLKLSYLNQLQRIIVIEICQCSKQNRDKHLT